MRYLGLVVLAAATWLVIAESAGWVGADLAEPWILPGIWTGGALLGLGLLLGVLYPVGRRMRSVRCARCRRPIERGQTYCADHLRETLDEYRDRQRDEYVR